jgi:2-iminobutanoate/2-iminopropanoate deaminase
MLWASSSAMVIQPLRIMIRALRTAALLGAITAACAGAQATPPAASPAGPNQGQYIGTRGALSEAVRVGNMLYLSGKLPARDSVGKGIAAETKSVMDQIKRALEANGSSMDRVVKCTVWLIDMADWAAMTAAYTEFFPKNKPARSAIGTSGLLNNAKLEVECMATVG